MEFPLKEAIKMNIFNKNNVFETKIIEKNSFNSFEDYFSN